MKPRARESFALFAFLAVLHGCGTTDADEAKKPPAPAPPTSNSAPLATPPTPPAPFEHVCESDEVVTKEGCPFPACSCPSECMALEASVFDEPRQCTRRATLGCLPPGGLSTDGPCFKRIADGLIVHASSTGIAQVPGFTDCTEAERSKVVWKSCPD